jgi:hypothetical protein
MRFGIAVFAGIGTLIWALGEASPASVDQGATCGQPGLPPCPLQSFMRNQVAAPLARGDMKAISGSLRKVATIAPPAWASWSATALEGAGAADRGDRAALRAACNTCHQTWREEYKQRYRERPLPP